MSRTLLKPLTAPWAITEEGMQLVLAVWSRGELFARVREQALAARRGEPLENARRTTTREGVAVLPVRGPLFRHASMFSDISGATSYADIRRDLQAALDAPDVRAILLDVDSPGGEVNGCDELAQAIRAACAVKPVVAYVGGTGASAAYWLASAAERVVVAETAMLGSIGVRIAITDDSEAQKMEGLRTVEIVSSQSPDKRSRPVDDSLVARLQSRADEMAVIFLGAVARHRGVNADRVASDFGRGDVVLGQRAIEAGMADAIGTFESALAELAARHNHFGSMTMETNKTPAASMSDGTCNGCGKEMAGACYCADCAGKGGEEAKLQLAAVLGALGTASVEEARALARAGAEALAALPGVRQELAKAQADLVRRDLRAALNAGLDSKRLSLGAIQTTVPLFVADEGQRGKMLAALAAIPQVTRAAVIDAACSVDITSADLRTIQSYARVASPVVAEPVREPARDAEGDAKRLDETEARISAAASEARQVLDRSAPAPAAK